MEPAAGPIETSVHAQSACIGILPPELLFCILCCVLQDLEFHWPFSYSSLLQDPCAADYGQIGDLDRWNRVRELCTVCSLWRKVISVIPVLYSNVSVSLQLLAVGPGSVSPERWLPLLDKLLRRSFGADLSLSLTFSDKERHPGGSPALLTAQNRDLRVAILQRLLQEALRVVSMKIDLNYFHESPLLPELLALPEVGRALKDLQFPSLRHLSLHCVRGSNEEPISVICLLLFPGFRELRSLYLRQCTVDPDHLHLDKLSKLHVHGKFRPLQILSLLRAVRNSLVALELELDFGTTDVPRIRSDHITLPLLRSLTYTNCIGASLEEFEDLMNSLDFPALEHFQFDWDMSPSRTARLDEVLLAERRGAHILHNFLSRSTSQLKRCEIYTRFDLSILFAPPVITSCVETLEIEVQHLGLDDKPYYCVQILPALTVSTDIVSLFPQLRHLSLTSYHCRGEQWPDSAYWHQMTALVRSRCESSCATIRKLDTMSLVLSRTAVTKEGYPPEARAEFGKWKAMGVEIMIERLYD